MRDRLAIAAIILGGVCSGALLAAGLFLIVGAFAP